MTPMHAHVRCHRATQLRSGSITAMTPSNCVVVHDWMRSAEPFICVERHITASAHTFLVRIADSYAHLHDLLAVRAPVALEVRRGHDDRAEQACAERAHALAGNDGGSFGHFVAE